MKRVVIVSIAWLSLAVIVSAFPAKAADKLVANAGPEDPRHGELRAFRQRVVKAINNNDVDSLLTHLSDDVVVTWQNAETSRGHKGVREYYDRMMHGPDPIVKTISSNPVPDQLTQLFGDTGLAHGKSDDHFVLTDGREFTIGTVWSAAVAKQDGDWKIASFHASTNMFDNPILWQAVRQTAMVSGLSALAIGAALGGLVTWLLRRGKAAPHAAS